MVTSPKIIVFSDSNEPVDTLSQMTDFFYEILPLSFSSDLKKTNHLKKIVASIIIKPPAQPSVYKKLKQVRTAFPKIPILMIADSPSQEEIIKAFRMGISDFLIVPVEASELISCLNRHTWLLRNNIDISVSPVMQKWNLLKQGYYSLLRKLKFSPPLKITAKNIQTSLNSSIIPLPMIRVSPTTEKSLYVNMLGKFRISFKGKKEVKIKGHNAKSLLAYFFHHRKRPVHREKLMNLFWPDSLPDCARNCLNVTIHSIRKILHPLTGGKDIIIFKDECYSFQPEPFFEIDVERFNYFWRKGLVYENSKDVEKSIDLYYKSIAFYKGDFLEDFLYDEWCDAERENLKERYLVILDRLSQYSFRQGNYNATVELCNIMLDKDNCLEEVHRRLIASYRALGARDKAIRQFKKCVKTLQSELGIEPSQVTRELYDNMRT